MTDSVLVVGAGPVGMAMALASKRQGLDVRIVDKAAARTDKSKALVIWPRTLELLDIQGCVQPFIDAGMPAHGARIVAGGHTLVHVTFDTARSAYRYALMIPQSDTERLLEEQLAVLGVQVDRQVELISFVDDGDGVKSTLRHADGREEVVRTAYLSGCDGAHSAVRHGLGAHFAGHTLTSQWVLGDMELDGEIPRDELTICWTPDGVLVFFPIGGNRYRVIADVGLATSEEQPPPPTLEEVQTLLDQRGPKGLVGHDPIWLSCFRINERKVKDYRHGRVFLSGDAAHVHSPAGGQGMNTGMQDAFNLSWKLAMVCSGRALPALLDSYSPERSAIGDQVLRNAGTMTKVAIMRNPVLQEIRGLAASALGHVPALRQRLIDQLTEVDLNYRDGPMTFKSTHAARHPSAGDRAPNVDLAPAGDGAANLHEALGTSRFVVLSVGAPRVVLPDSMKRVAVATVAASATGYDEGHIYLIRPDAYVVTSAGADDAEAIIGALKRIGVGY
jgi:2-polyprenyl-6-methoxyphenol hydroxylase-like FAD-dependent oxidoreductase